MEGGQLRHKYPDGRTGPAYNYLNDLNACHEFEKTLTGEEKVKYLYVLRDVVRGKSLTHPFGMESAFDCAFATAAQRCEAFLKAKNLWVDQ